MQTGSEIRQQFIDFFVQRHEHTFVRSSSVVPTDDPTLLFSNAGMNQFKDVFLGTGTRPYKRAVNTQKCIRAGGKHNDLDDVGKDTYHHTFFEMLGNWSFGDYFKREAIRWAWELLTEVWKLDPSRLHVTVFGGDPAEGLERDDEARELWRSEAGVPDDHIHFGSKKDNFWEMGSTGPCGPCTEIHIDRTPDKSGAKLVNAGTPEVIEIWNNVFIQYNRGTDGKLTVLPAQHVDTGMGFERVTAVLQGRSSNYDTDVFTPLFTAIRDITGGPEYTGILSDRKDIAYRVIADHIRMLTFALTDRAVFDFKGRGAVLRSVLRRAFRFGYQVFGQKQPFLTRLVPTVVATMREAFPELVGRAERVQKDIEREERDFLKTIERGLGFFEEAAGQAVGGKISGRAAFELHTNRGFPVDLTRQMALELGLGIDEAEFEAAIEEHRKASAGKKIAGQVAISAEGGLPATDDALRWETRIADGEILGYVADNSFVNSGSVPAGREVGLVLDRTCFYAESGGQVGDTGTIRTPSGLFTVNSTTKLGSTVVHLGQLTEGTVSVGESASLVVDAERDFTRKNHTATHLLHWALQKVLGDHVEQRGSKVKPDELTFDFSHEGPLTAEQLCEVERLVNEKVYQDEPVEWRELPIEEAKKLPGVRAFFGDKYGAAVRVVEIGDGYSREFCGGTHLDRTGEIGLFKIIGQSPVSKGVRRISAVTARSAVERVQTIFRVTDELCGKLNCKPEELLKRIEGVQAELAKVQKQLTQASSSDVQGVADQLYAEAEEVAGIRLIFGLVPTAAEEVLRTQADRLRQMAKSAVLMFGWEDEGKAMLLAAASKDAIEKGVKAGDLVKQVVGIVDGKGGGPPTMATASGKSPSKLAEALAKAKELAIAGLKR